MKNNTFMRKIIYPYTPAMVNSLERWLSLKASDGWRLEEVHGWSFVFRKCKPYQTKYFSYTGFGTNIGISHDYWASKRRYSRNQSIVNKANLEVYEVDLEKVDVGFRQLVLLRNKFYLKHYFALLAFSIIYTMLAITLLPQSNIVSVFQLVGFISLVYSVLSVLILAYEIVSKRQGDGSLA